MTSTVNPTYAPGVVHDTKKHDDAPEFAILAQRIDALTTVLAASAQGHFQRNLVAADIGNPAPLGFFAFAITLGLYMCVEARIVEQAALFYVLPLAIFLGGLAMYVTAILELVRRNALGYSAFGAYGTFFIAVGVHGMCEASGLFFLPAPKGQQALTALFGIVSLVFAAVSVAICLLLPIAFVMLAVLFFTLSAGFVNPTATKAAGWWGLVTAAVAMYAGAAFLFEEIWGKEILPIFYTKPYKVHAAHLFPRISTSDPRSVTAGVPYPGRPEIHRGDNQVAGQTAPSLVDLNRVKSPHNGADHV
ncbi:Uncharacterized protein F751_3713 [Auxenochlorella protothecoides]|uniref:Uncharacterized protein n=2 Tax=Auxenochlorella protothecoides TaxID=3075 RepID=A0A087STP2_AUXPR|nr:Uncharacterized protein F751_3713 [Auxenochlorella protothecoides]KFM29096.1 Uncharacterized protein F751_3713 [Auxenochlorella protothecoides]RMZ52387.1 hypothetical protein APUTEX25_000662 [Auxenochlorella protothecoides]|eukprot:RMZ52387.1 hypothetical protein APUTEX25_000662 [Auxenochlorella protothecoides]